MFRLVIKGDLGFEIWQDIPDYEGLYQASTYGRIKSVERECIRGRGGKQILEERILKPSFSRDYLKVVLCKDAKTQSLRIHRLVALTFLPKPQEGQTQINHKSEVKTENQVGNLEWCTPEYNNSYGTRSERSKEKQHNSPKLGKKVLQLDFNGKIINSYPSVGAVVRATCFDKGNIINCCNGKMKSAYGYIWKYA